MKTTNDIDGLVMEDVKLVLKNFSGKEDKFNRAGDRNFAVLLDDRVAAELTADGWAVKWFKIKNPDDEPQAFLKVKLNFKGRKPPLVVMISSKGRTPLREDMVEMLDYVNMKTVDLIVRPYEWEAKGETGISAYLQSIFVTLDENYLDRKYADLEERNAE